MSNTHNFQERTYRDWVDPSDLSRFQVVVKETDLQIWADRDLTHAACESILTHRGYLESYIQLYPQFNEVLTPWHLHIPAQGIVRDMIMAAQTAQVGPMAAVAGAIAESVGRDLQRLSPQVVIENGGDIFIKLDRDVTVGLYAGNSPLSGRIGIRLTKDIFPVAICTSSATIGHSVSLGGADAACILSKSGALADAAATAVGNMTKCPSDIPAAIDFARNIAGVAGVVIVVGQKMGMWGKIELVPFKRKKRLSFRVANSRNTSRLTRR